MPAQRLGSPPNPVKAVVSLQTKTLPLKSLTPHVGIRAPVRLASQSKDTPPLRGKHHGYFRTLSVNDWMLEGH
jgi:hypothetical protein